MRQSGSPDNTNSKHDLALILALGSWREAYYGVVHARRFAAATAKNPIRPKKSVKNSVREISTYPHTEEHHIEAIKRSQTPTLS